MHFPHNDTDFTFHLLDIFYVLASIDGNKIKLFYNYITLKSLIHCRLKNRSRGM